MSLLSLPCTPFYHRQKSISHGKESQDLRLLRFGSEFHEFRILLFFGTSKTSSGHHGKWAFHFLDVGPTSITNKKSLNTFNFTYFFKQFNNSIYMYIYTLSLSMKLISQKICLYPMGCNVMFFLALVAVIKKKFNNQ